MAEQRWGQLTYASFDTGDGGAGGWGVKETSGGVTDAETEGIRSRIATLFDAGEEVPQFPSPEEIARLPRKLTYVPLEDSSAYGYWHAVPSGLDGTGRPGNVFSHVLLDRRSEEALPALRPIDLWRSPSWLTPFGQPEVLATALGTGAPVLGSAVSRDTILDFLLDPSVFRGAILTVLLDAVAAAVSGGRRVIVATENPDAAAQWIGAVTHLMAPRTSREVPFSVLERPSGLDSVLRRGALLVGVPHADAEAAAKVDNVVVIDDRMTPALGDLGGEPHRIGEAAIPVTEWSVIAEVVLQEPDLARSVLDRLDSVCAELPETVLAPAWPLAMVVALLPDELSDATSEAARVLRDTSPAGLRNHPGLWAAVAMAAQGLFGSSTQHVLDQVRATSGASGSVVHDLAVAVYQERVLDDPAWLMGPQPAPAPRTSSGSSDVLTSRAVGALAAVAASDPGSRPLARDLARLGDWIVASGLVGAGDTALQAPLETLVREHLLPLLLDPARGGQFVGLVGPVSEPFAADWVRPLVDGALAASSGMPGSRLDPAVVQWLFPEPPSSLDASRQLTDLELEYIIEGIAMGRPGLDSLRVPAWVALVERGATGEDNPRSKHLVREESPWSVQEVLAVESQHAAAVPAPLVAKALIDAPDGPELSALILEVLRTAPTRRNGGTLAAVAEARELAQRLAAGGTMTRGEAAVTFGTITKLHRLTPSWAALLGLVASYVVGITGKAEYAFTRERVAFLGTALSSVSLDAFETSVQLHAAEGVFSHLDFPRAVQFALQGAEDCPVPLADPGEEGMARLSGTPGDSDGRLIVIVASAMAVEGVPRLEMALGSAEALVARQIPVGRIGEKIAADFDRFARPWWKYFKSLDPSQNKSRTRRRGLFGITASDKENT